jgi:RNA processing factor Prp31
MTYLKQHSIQTTTITRRVLFDDDTSVIVSNPNLTDFERDINMVFKNMNEWFSVNLHSLNFCKSQFMQFLIKNGSLNKINIEYNNKNKYQLPLI